MAEYMQATKKVIEMAQELIREYHEPLLDARIGFIMRVDVATRNGRPVLGKARKVSTEQQMFMDLDFVIWLAHDEFKRMGERQQKALIDHELCHCRFDPDDDTPARIAGHDVEEFNCILQRWGFWWPTAKATELAVQGRLGIEERVGEAVAIKDFDPNTGLPTSVEGGSMAHLDEMTFTHTRPDGTSIEATISSDQAEAMADAIMGMHQETL